MVWDLMTEIRGAGGESYIAGSLSITKEQKDWGEMYGTQLAIIFITHSRLWRTKILNYVLHAGTYAEVGPQILQSGGANFQNLLTNVESFHDHEFLNLKHLEQYFILALMQINKNSHKIMEIYN